MTEKENSTKTTRKDILSMVQIYRRINDFMRNATEGYDAVTLMDLIYDKTTEQLHPKATEEYFPKLIRNGIKSHTLENIFIDDENFVLPISLMPCSSSGLSLNSDLEENMSVHTEIEESEGHDEVYLFDEQIEANKICMQRWGDMPQLPRIISFLQRVGKVKKKFAFHTWLEDIQEIIGGLFDFQHLGLGYPGELFTLKMLVASSTTEGSTQLTIAIDQCILQAFVVDRTKMDPNKQIVFNFLNRHGGKANSQLVEDETGIPFHTIVDIVLDSSDNFDVTFENDETKFSLKSFLLVLD